MRFFPKHIFLVCILLFTSPVFSQEVRYNHGALDWYTIETPHFNISYHTSAERTARVIAKVAEDIYGPVTTLYQHEPDHKVSIVVMDYSDYSNGAAYFYDNKIQIFAPALDFVLRGTHNWLRNVIAHEFTHIIQIQASMKFGRRFPAFYFQWLNYEEERRQDVLYGYPNTVVSYPLSGFVVPSWFAEGVAQYNRPELSYDYWDSHRDMILRSYVLDGAMLTWNEMGVFGKTSLGNESAYNAGFALTRYISQKYGNDAIPKIAKNISRIKNITIDQAIEEAVGIGGSELYNNWKKDLTEDYNRRIAPVKKNNIEGTPTADVGFGNFYSAYSPNQTKVAYTSNKEADYFGLSSVYVYDFETKKEKQIYFGVNSALSWSRDGRKIYFSKLHHTNQFKISAETNDVFAYDIENEEEIQITKNLRAADPSVSPDGNLLCFVTNSDGTLNIMISDTAGNNARSVTKFTSGEQVFLPKWSPDGKKIIFGFSTKDGQDIAQIDIETAAMEIIIGGENDSRDPRYSRDGKFIYFSSDRTGIFNIYRLNVESKKIEQLTNVLGGAFMPAVNDSGDITYSLYTSKGYKIYTVANASPRDFSDAKYLEPEKIRRPEIVIDDTSAIKNKFDFVSLRNYDDTKLIEAPSSSYKNIYSTLSIIPLLRIDNYNTKSSGLDFLKPGFYFMSSDMVDKMSMFGGAAVNHQLERDLFISFEYGDRLMGLKEFNFFPFLSLEIYNISRKRTNEKISIVDEFEETSADITYSLAEFDVYMKWNLLSTDITLGYSHSRYSSAVSSFLIKSSALLVPASSENYFIGNNILLQLNMNGIVRSTTREINPVGFNFYLRLDNEFNNFTKEDSTGTSEVEATDTGIKLKLVPYTIRRLETKYTHHFQLPFWKHTLSFTLRGGTIFGPRVPDFFDFYAGGLVGMKGYPFYSIGGNEVASLNAAYRFPIWENIDLRFAQIYFDKMYGEFHADIGNAWNGLPNIRDFKRDVGFELRLQAFSWYAFPTNIFFNGTYGLDSFTLTKRGNSVTYGKEWRFYFGMLFDFDFSNNIQRLQFKDPNVR